MLSADSFTLHSNLSCTFEVLSLIYREMFAFWRIMSNPVNFKMLRQKILYSEYVRITNGVTF
jgi:hypothetical protein